jgi:hypothetical protein
MRTAGNTGKTCLGVPSEMQMLILTAKPIWMTLEYLTTMLSILTLIEFEVYGRKS